MKVILGLSGGVDSAVAAINLINDGYEVEACFMRNWDSMLNNDVLGNPNDFNDVCPQEKDYMDALDVANKLGIKLHRIDFVKEYWDNVFEYFLDEYKKGRTPNPDILCNKEIKFKCFLDFAMKQGADYIAMGHYANVEHTDHGSYLLRAKDNNKDQTYFLCQLSSAQLDKALFPIGNMIKKDVREVALKYNLNVAKKKDSTGICFIGERRFNEFLTNYLPAKPGNMVMLDGRVMGRHDGLMYYTIGQRKGIKIGGLNEFDNDAWFVLGKDIKRNVLIVGRGSEQEYLYSNRCLVSKMNWIGPEIDESKEYLAKFRYRGIDYKVNIHPLGDGVYEVVYPGRAKAVTPGQEAVFYDGERLMGGATIDSVYMDQEKRCL